MAQQRLLALGDILGFQETILGTDLQVVINNYLGFFRSAIEHALFQRGWPSVPNDWTSMREAAKIGMEWFSDTIILYTLDDTDDAARNLVEITAWLLFETMYKPPVRLRFGLDYGELHIDPNAGQIVGKAVVGAFQLQAAQEWVGGALTPAAATRVRGLTTHIVEYVIPLKQQAIEKGIRSSTAINWSFGVHLGFFLPFSLTSRTPPPDVAPDIRTKWENTIAFHDQVCAVCVQNRPAQTPIARRR